MVVRGDAATLQEGRVLGVALGLVVGGGDGAVGRVVP